MADRPLPKDDDLDFATLLARSLEELRIKTEAHGGTWHLGEAAWSVDQEAGQIVFSAPGGVCPTR
jgi:hypothetical protein